MPGEVGITLRINRQRRSASCDEPSCTTYIIVGEGSRQIIVTDGDLDAIGSVKIGDLGDVILVYLDINVLGRCSRGDDVDLGTPRPIGEAVEISQKRGRPANNDVGNVIAVHRHSRPGSRTAIGKFYPSVGIRGGGELDILRTGIVINNMDDAGAINCR